MHPKLLVVDDDPGIRKQMQWALAQEYEILVAEDRPSALTAFKRAHPSVVTLNLGLPLDVHGVAEGFHTLRDMLHEDARAKVIVITGQEEREHAPQEAFEDILGTCPPMQEVFAAIRRPVCWRPPISTWNRRLPMASFAKIYITA